MPAPPTSVSVAEVTVALIEWSRAGAELFESSLADSVFADHYPSYSQASKSSEVTELAAGLQPETDEGG